MGFPSSAARWALLTALLLTVVLPRFNLRDPGPIRRFTASATATPYGLPLDVEGYIRLGKFFRGTVPADSLIPPYCYRPLVPFAASLLPFDVQTAINIVDVLALLLGMVMLDRLLLEARFGERSRTAGGAMFAVSFPTFYYGAIGLVDPAAVLMVAILAFLALRQRHALFTAAVVAAVLVKETNGMMALLPGALAWARGRLDSGTLARTAGWCLLAVLTALAVRILPDFPEPGWFWLPRPASVAENLSRPRAIVSLILTVGLPGAMAVAAALKGRPHRVLGPSLSRFFTAGATISVCLYLYSLFTAYADGRVIWILYPFAIPIALTLIAADPRARLPRGAGTPMIR